MMSFLLEILANFVAGAIAVIVAYVWGWLPKRAQRRWMGMSGKTSPLQIYASNITVRKGGTEPVEGETITVGFTGAAMNEREYLEALKLRDSLRPSRIIEAVADLFNRQVKQTDVHVCPRKWDDRRMPHSNLVFLGSPIYNSGTKHYLQAEGGGRVRFFLDASNGRTLRVDDQDYWRNPSAEEGAHGEDYGVIYRMNRHGRSIFICAGLGTEGTCAAADHLATRWKEIRKECGEGEFIALLKKKADVKKPRITYEYKEVLERERESSGQIHGGPEQSEA